ncbi:jg7575 [Pararge aegeria aegeria]|uniref:Jg7575 protein n=1 Tax=Pararge aegeria aegeria TaxID=348720 RepID=A0A8S4QFP7_9NEOP|nr:jg7575 [Pararge aegeria aegeria]
MLVAEKKEMEEKEINKRTDSENNGHPDPQNNYQAGLQPYSFKNESERPRFIIIIITITGGKKRRRKRCGAVAL